MEEKIRGASMSEIKKKSTNEGKRKNQGKRETGKWYYALALFGARNPALLFCAVQCSNLPLFLLALELFGTN
jgi:hypothetical protein